MDISIVVSLVGSGSALLGTLIGGIISQRSLSRQIRAEDMRRLRSEKINAYTNFLTAYTSYMEHSLKLRMSETHDIADEMSSLYQFHSASSAAVLLAPSSVGCELKALIDMSSRYAEGQIDAQQVGEKFMWVEALLHKDLEQSSVFKR
ncbi:MAG: hypothetical protein HDT20_04440 [Oscillibacter sp.]|nr:hypothetical protein [Oscillibacter sp.]